MQVINIPTLKATAAHICFRLREPLMIWGEPGVGKSQAVWQLAAEHNAYMIDIRLSQYDSVDLRGIPTAEQGVTMWNVPATLPFKNNPRFADMAHRIIVLFLDEINSAAPSVSAVAYQLVHDRKVGEHELMDNVIIIAAGNREGDRGVTNKQPLPLSNRFTHVEVGPDADAVCEHFRVKGVAPIGVAFLQLRKQLVSTFMVQKEGEQKPSVTLNKAFATARTWEKAFGYFSDTTMPENIKRIATAGAVGSGESDEFWGFVAIYDQIKTLIPSIMKDPATAEVPDKKDFVYALCVALSGSMSVTNVGVIHTYLKRLDAEFVVLAWLLALKRNDDLYGTPEFMDYAGKYKQAFDA